MKKILNDNRGVAIVEFAIIAPLLFTLIFGIIEFGFYLYNQEMLTNAAREGARAGIVATDPRVPATGDNSIEYVVQHYCADHMITFGNKNNPILDPNPPSGYAADAEFGDQLVVRVKYHYSFFVLPSFIPGIQKLQTEIENMVATATMRYE